MFVENIYDFGDIVFLKTDAEQNERIVTGISIRPNGPIIYYLNCGQFISSHYEMEIIKEKEFKITSHD